MCPLLQKPRKAALNSLKLLYGYDFEFPTQEIIRIFHLAGEGGQKKKSDGACCLGLHVQVEQKKKGGGGEEYPALKLLAPF